jgi:hypothetical protein
MGVAPMMYRIRHVAQATALVQGVMTKYNEIVAQITREARDAK